MGKFLGYFDGIAAVRSATTVATVVRAKGSINAVVVCVLFSGSPLAFKEER